MGTSVITLLGYPIGFILRYSNRLLNGIPTICTDGDTIGTSLITLFISYVSTITCYIFVQRLVSSVITSIMGHSLLHQNIFCFKRRLFFNKCRYCFLETAPKCHIDYIRRRKTSLSWKVSFLDTFYFSPIFICEKILSWALYCPQSSVTKFANLALMTAEPGFDIYEGEIQMEDFTACLRRKWR